MEGGGERKGEGRGVKERREEGGEEGGGSMELGGRV